MAPKNEAKVEEKSAYESFKEEVAKVEEEYPKVLKGNATAATRFRKALMNIRTLAKTMREQSLVKPA